MKLKDKIELVRNQLPLPSEVAAEEIVYTLKHHRFINSIKPHYPQMVLTCETQLTFQKEYVADMAIGWNFVKLVD